MTNKKRSKESLNNGWVSLSILPESIGTWGVSARDKYYYDQWQKRYERRYGRIPVTGEIGRYEGFRFIESKEK